MASYQTFGRPLTSISEIRTAYKAGLKLNFGGEIMPAELLYNSSFRFLVDQIEQGAISWCEPSEEAA
jgi:hypothetical protein